MANSGRATAIILLGVWLVVQGVVLLHVALQLWPAVIEPAREAISSEDEAATTSTDGNDEEDQQQAGAAQEGDAADDGEDTEDAAPEVSLFFGALRWAPPPDTALLALVLAIGALGAYIHAATSFGSHLGLQDFNTSWLWWYGLRGLVGASLAGLLYLAVRGGLVSVSTEEADINPYGIAALAGLAGLFSTPLTSRLATIFDALLGREGAAKAVVTRRRPSVTDIAPKDVPSGTDQDITITGENFVESSKVFVDDMEVGTTFISATTLKAVIPTAVLGQAGERKVTVINPGEEEHSEPEGLTVT